MTIINWIDESAEGRGEISGNTPHFFNTCLFSSYLKKTYILYLWKDDSISIIRTTILQGAEMVCEYLKTFLWRVRSGNEVNSRKGSSLKIDGNHFVHLPYLVFVFVTGSHYAAQGALDLLSTSDTVAMALAQVWKNRCICLCTMS